MIPWLISIPLAYLLGSIPFGYVLVRIFRKQDIRSTGSGNIGATNVARSGAKGLAIATLLLDLGKAFTAVKIAQHIAPASYDLIAICYYLQRSLFDPAKQALVPGGILIAIALLAEPGKDNSFRVQPGELLRTFHDWEILHHREGGDAWQHNVAEIVARKLI